MVWKRAGGRRPIVFCEPLESRLLLAANATPVVSVAIKGSASEKGPTAAVITFTRKGDAAVPLVVGFATSGDAVRDADFTLSGDPGVLDGAQVTFAAGVKKVSLQLVAVADMVAEPNEKASITVEIGAGYTVDSKPSRASASTVIKNLNHLPFVMDALEGQTELPVVPQSGGETELPIEMLAALAGDPDSGTVLQFELIPAPGVNLTVNGKSTGGKKVLVAADDTVIYRLQAWGNLGTQAVVKFQAFDGAAYSYFSPQFTVDLPVGPNTESYDDSLASEELALPGPSNTVYNPVTGIFCRLLERTRLDPILDNPGNFRSVSTIEYGERGDDGTWSSEDLTGLSPAISNDRSISTLRVDSQGRPEVLAVSSDEDGTTVTRLRRDPVAGWQVVEVAPIGVDNNGGYVSFDAAGRIVMTEPFHRRGVWANGQWTWQDLPNDVAGPIVEDAAGHLHMIYADEVDHASGYPAISLGYATNANGTWVRTRLQAVTGAGDAATWSSIALDPTTGRPVVANWSVTQAKTGSAQSSRLNFHALGANGKWVHQTVASKSLGFTAGDGERGTGYDPTVMFDSQGHATIFFTDFASEHSGGFQEWAPGQLRQATLVGGHWQLQTLFPQSSPFANHLANYSVTLGGELALVSITRELEPGGPFTAKHYVRSDYLASALL